MRSINPISGNIGYFWGEFNDSGIRYGQGDEEYKGNLPRAANLNLSAFDTNKFNFSNNEGSIEFQLDSGNKITNIKVTLTNSEFNYGTFDAQFVQK